MDFGEVLDQRFSCRRFLDTAVPKETVKEITQIAQKVPSWGNTQPWKVYVAAGETARSIREGQVLAFSQGVTDRTEIPMPASFDPPLSDRYRHLGRSLFAWLDIDRKDRERRAVHYAENLDAFGAPVLAYITVPASQGEYAVLDAGAFITAFCLAAAERGLATCIQAALVRYPEVVRRQLPVSADEKIVVGIALGYPDLKAKVNEFRSERAAVEEILTLKGFD